MKIETFLCQLVLATLANTIAGFINRNSRDGKNLQNTATMISK